MKILFPIITVACLAVACNNPNKDTSSQQQATIDSMKTVMEKQRIIDSMKNEIAAQPMPVQAEPVHHSRHHTSSEAAAPVQTTAAAPAAKKKGWSNTAKGAVIGAGVGAVSGALIDGKHGEGAIIGGLIGAGAGAGTGALIDRKKRRDTIK